ncbi:hypothetical protein [Leadbetterella byssophila]|uniref:DUF3575 domain-containing protein n=1 Tax=Leadbetterella byssophila (strain DSM 17132 / JCM 16389 / KACC 11308 / NBRC 106382 / 4M15) TaxID=649349 RepID=E4RXJ5_LEAB4|nr:hypothetical protein [Leadbetterella byssophila]ADQ17230.1 hypothetical protein Lbys_1518 [Leadbetterella byssophila DSM 17132]
MNKKSILIALSMLIASTLKAKAQYSEQDSSKWFVGSTLMLLGNFIPNDPNPPGFIQINVGYRFTPQDAGFIELKTSKFNWPLGMPWKEIVDKDRAQHNFPGYVRQYVLGLAYNRYWYKGLFSGIHAMNAFQTYKNEDRSKINRGYTLFMTYRIGYHFKMFNQKVFIEPSIGLTHWPIKTNTPMSFKEKENQWPNYFGWEPGLHFGFNL